MFLEDPWRLCLWILKYEKDFLSRECLERESEGIAWARSVDFREVGTLGRVAWGEGGGMWDGAFRAQGSSPPASHLWAERTRITDNITKCLLCVCTFWAINPHDSSMEKYCCCPILQLGKVRHRLSNLPKITQLARADLSYKSKQSDLKACAFIMPFTFLAGPYPSRGWAARGREREVPPGLGVILWVTAAGGCRSRGTCIWQTKAQEGFVSSGQGPGPPPAAWETGRRWESRRGRSSRARRSSFLVLEFFESPFSPLK